MYWTVATVTMFPDEKTGKLKKLKESFLVKGFTPTDVEAKMYERNKNLASDWKISSISESKILEVIE